jgi:hypothetical protein
MEGIGSARLSHLYMEEFMAIKKGVRRYKEPEVPTKQVETAPKVPAV